MIISTEVLLNWRGLKNASLLDSSYQPDELDNIPVSACAVGMIYSFYGRLSISMNNVPTLRAANLPPAFYCWGTRDGFAGQFDQNSNAVREAGVSVTTHILQNYPHGYGTGGSPSVWVNAFDAFLAPIMQRNTTSMTKVSMSVNTSNTTKFYDLSGKLNLGKNLNKAVYIVREGRSTHKIIMDP